MKLGSIDLKMLMQAATGGGAAAFDAVVTAYASRSGMDSSKREQLNDLVTYLKDAGLWDNVDHLYLATKGFNADSGATIYDVVDPVDGGQDLTQTNCTWGTSEGEGLLVTNTGDVQSSSAIIPTTGDNSVIHSLRYMKFTAAIGTRVWRQGTSPIYGLAMTYNADPVLQHFTFRPGTVTDYILDDSYRTPEVDAFSANYFKQSYWKHQPIAIVLNRATGKIFAYGNKDQISMLASADEANDGISVTPTVPDAIFEMGVIDREQFNLEYLVVMSVAVTGAQYQNITYQIEKAIAPRNPANVNSGMIWLDTNGNELDQFTPYMYYDSVTGLYYRYAIPGSLYTGTPPNDAPRGIYQGINVYSSSSMNGPWTKHGSIAYDHNNATLLTALGGHAVADCGVARHSVVYHTSRAKYVMGMKAFDKVDNTQIFVLAEADSPLGPFVTTFAGQINSEDVADCGLFKDDDGTAYVFYRIPSTGGFKVVALNADYDGISGASSSIGTNLEAPGIVKVGSRYWLVCSGVDGWNPTDHEAFYSDAANPLSGWTSIGNPFNSGDDAYQQSFGSQNYGLFKSANGSVIFNGTINIPMHFDPFDRRNTAMRPFMLPVSIVGTTMTIGWDPHWDPSSYE